MNKNLLYCIPAGQYGKEGVLSLLAQHPEIRFVSLVGIDLAGNDTDERIPIEIFMKDYEDFFAGKAVQTDGSSVVFMNIATLNDARVDMVADSTVNWYVDYNDDNVDEETGLPIGTLRIPSFLIHMATIDLIVLGMLKKEPMSAYDIQKLVEYRNISKWVKISTPSIYKKAIQLEEKGLIRGEVVKEGKMPEKAIYSLTEAGESEFERLMFEISSKPINIFLDFNAVIVNLDSLPAEKQRTCLAEIQENIDTLKAYLEQNIKEKEHEPSIPATGMAVLHQQYVLAEAIQTWINSLTKQ